MDGRKLFNALDALKDLMKRNLLDKKTERPEAEETELRTTTGVNVENPSQLETGRNEAIGSKNNLEIDPVAFSHTHGHLQALIAYLEKQFALSEEEMDRLLPKNKIRHHLLWCLFPLGSEIIFKDPASGVTCAGKVLRPLF